MNDLTQFFKRLKRITLSDNERLLMRERLFLYADMHPTMAPVASPYLNFFSFIGSRRFSTYAIAMVLIVSAGGGITLGAEGSVPGDSLYAIKINVNEPLMTAFAGSPIKQATVATDIATRRVDEAVILASRGELTDEREEYLSEKFDERVKVATAKTDELATVDSTAAETVKANFAANLAGEAQALGAQKHEQGKLLRVLVAASETVSERGTRPVLALERGDTRAAKIASSEAAGTAMRAEPDTTLLSKRAAPMLAATTSTTTQMKATTTPPIFNTLRVTATTTISGNASSTLQTRTLIFPKMDVAIPSSWMPKDTTFELNLRR